MHRRSAPLLVLAALAVPVATTRAHADPVIDLDAPPPPTETPRVASVSFLLSDGLGWGMPKDDVLAAFTKVGGVVDREYDPLLVKVPIGERMRAIENERDGVKAGIKQSWVAFNDTPTGFDSTAMRAEYSYGNQEGVLFLTRNGRRRFYFFIRNKLWKIYDEVSYVTPEQAAAIAKGASGPAPAVTASNFTEAATKLGITLGAPGKFMNADGARPTTVDWQDKLNHLRLVDRGGFFAVVLEDKGTLNQLGGLRKAPQPADTKDELDPLVKSILRGKEPEGPPPPSADPPKKKGKK